MTPDEQRWADVVSLLSSIDQALGANFTIAAIEDKYARMGDPAAFGEPGKDKDPALAKAWIDFNNAKECVYIALENLFRFMRGKFDATEATVATGPPKMKLGLPLGSGELGV